MRWVRALYERFRHLIPELLKFGVIGGIGFVVTLGGADLLRFDANLGKYTSVTIATIVATVFAFLGNKLWAFRHRKGSHLGRESVLFFVFNGIGLLIQLAFVAVATHVLGLNDKFSYNVANIIGIGVATIFRLYCYRRWVFLIGDGTPLAEQLEPETSDR